MGGGLTNLLGDFGGFGVAGFVLVAAGRVALRLNLRRLRAHGHNVKALVIIGGGPRGRRFAAQVKHRQDLGYKLLGYVDSDPAFSNDEVSGAPCLGTIEDLPRIISNEVIDEVARSVEILEIEVSHRSGTYDQYG